MSNEISNTIKLLNIIIRFFLKLYIIKSHKQCIILRGAVLVGGLQSCTEKFGAKYFYSQLIK